MIGHPFIELLSVDSTNNYAMALVHEGMAQHGTAVFAHEQTNGKGQRQKQWMAQPNNNIILSVVIEPGLAPSQAFSFSRAMAVGIYRFFNKYAGDEVRIKWPNDLYWRDRKAGGMLIENILQGQLWKYAVVGIGININQTNFEGLDNAVSLKQITGKTFDTVALAKELCDSLQNVFEDYKKLPAHIAEQYHQHLYKLNETVKLKAGSRVFEARIKGVNSVGQLIAQHATEEFFDIGDLEWIS